MKQVEVFEPAVCCATGVCGPEPDMTLVRFGETVRRAETELASEVRLTRYLLNQQPMKFAQVPAVFDILKRSGVSALPVVVVDGRVALEGSYPTFEQLAAWARSGDRSPEGR